ncbi:hypothetical protein G9A89_011414 [Geosiphon pyriformis]|nr:hypothetical protein G9A89_011414 [Geosiphon pyriformis]
MALAKIEGVLPEEIKRIKNNPPEPIELDWNPEPVINLLDPEQFHKYYQELAFTKEEQEQHLEHSCESELESNFNPNSNSDNNDNENNDSSSTQYSNKNNNDSDSDSNPKTYIALSDLTKEQELK